MHRYNQEKTYSYIKGYAMALNFTETLKAMQFARDKHSGQNRKNGESYIIHPLTMASHAIALGFKDDKLLATILLHDVVEDCGVGISELPVSDEVKEAVDRLTFKNCKSTKEFSLVQYYIDIGNNYYSMFAKLIDRCHNVSSMAGVFTDVKLQDYISETETYILPLLRKAKQEYPEKSNELFILKYHIESILDSLKAVSKS